MKSNYKQLGDIVRWCDERNRGEETSDVQGVSIGKEYMPSVANIIGTDLSNYKIVRVNRFACNPMHVGRDRVLPVALYTKETPAIVSPAYFTFEVINDQEVLPEYLMLFFRTPTFDKNCWFRTDGSVRGGISWDDMCRVELPVPDICLQRKFVQNVNRCTRLIKTTESIIRSLEKSLMSLYSNCLIHADTEDSEMRICNMGDLCTTVGGGTPSTSEPEYYEGGTIPWVTPTDITQNNCLALIEPQGQITELGLSNSSAKMLPPNTILMTSRASVGYFALCEKSVCTNQGFISCIPKQPYYRMFLLCNLINRVDEIHVLADGGATYAEISKKDFNAMLVKLPSAAILEDFEKKAWGIFSLIRILKKESEFAEKTRTLLLSTYS